MTSLSKRPPVYKQKSHGIEVAVWKREHEDKAFNSVSATRSYRDSDGNWKTSGSFNLEDRDILVVIEPSEDRCSAHCPVLLTYGTASGAIARRKPSSMFRKSFNGDSPRLRDFSMVYEAKSTEP